MDVRCSQLLPSVCTILADPGNPVADDTCLEKLLDWFKTLTSAGPSLLLLDENPCLTELILAVLKQEEPNPSLLSFVLRLTGILAASESSFQRLQQQDVVSAAFGEAGPLGSAMWKDMTVRSGWVQGLCIILNHPSAVQFLCDSGALEVSLALQEDPGLFVAAGARRLLVGTLVFAVRSEKSCLLGAMPCDWPACARPILAQIEESLRSRSSSRVKYSLTLLRTLFESCQDAWTEKLWSGFSETIGTLLSEEPVPVGDVLGDLLLSLARSPAFRCHECNLWDLVAFALKNLSLAQVGPLALGLMKLEACPPGIKAQSLAVLLRPMGCILRTTSHSVDFSGWLEGSLSDASSAESLLSTRTSCLSLLCQTMAYLEEIQGLTRPVAEFPYPPLLCSVVTVLQFCLGLALPTSSFGSAIGKILIGSFRVQRAALSLLQGLAQAAASVQDEAVLQVFEILLAYLRSPDSGPVILKKAFQGSLEWLLSTSEPSDSPVDFQRRRQFLRDTIQVLQKHLCSPSWEVRDSTLEYLSLAMKELGGQKWFWEELLSSEVPALLEDLLEDPESYVRASAVKAYGHFSLTASTGSEVPALEAAGRRNKVSAGTRLMEILSSDSEGFPRRAVIRVFTDWLKAGHPEVLAAPEEFVSEALRAAEGDLDWEVKVTALELVEVFAAQTFGLGDSVAPAGSFPARPLAPLPELLQMFSRMKVFAFLFGALQDCDRPVALKACQLLLALKATVCQDKGLPQRPPPSGDPAQLQEMPTGSPSGSVNLPGGDSAEKVSQDPEGVCLTLEKMDLEGLQRALDVSSDHLERSPLSLLQDILSAAGSSEENKADCY